MCTYTRFNLIYKTSININAVFRKYTQFYEKLLILCLLTKYFIASVKYWLGMQNIRKSVNWAFDVLRFWISVHSFKYNRTLICCFENLLYGLLRKKRKNFRSISRYNCWIAVTLCDALMNFDEIICYFNLRKRKIQYPIPRKLFDRYYCLLCMKNEEIKGFTV